MEAAEHEEEYELISILAGGPDTSVTLYTSL